MFVGLEEFMARKNSGVSLKPISTEIGRAVTKLRGVWSKASRADKKILSLKMHKLKKMKYSVYGLCKYGRKFMDAVPVVTKLPRRPTRPQR
jgi:hypothetical protein